MDYLSMGKNIKALRKKNGLTQEKLAEAVDVSTVFISQIETGTRMPSLETIYNISKALGVSIDELIHGSESGHLRIHTDNKFQAFLNSHSEAEVEFTLKIAEGVLNYMRELPG